ncbi:MAG: diaminopimelate decarboxylase [Oscillospiraceae bacterium]|nr:diaminopimelate decarboxylase [Oscillospiraceae bacterium]
MYLPECIGINSQGRLTIGGVDTVKIAGQYGTPLYVMSEQQLRENCREFTGAIREGLDGHGLALYSCKALCCKYICNICDEEGLGLNVTSGCELYTALKAGFPAEKISFHGNNKSKAELSLAVDSSVGRINIDNLPELESLTKIAAEKGKTVSVMLRLKPSVAVHTFEAAQTGQIDSKFGFALETGEAMDAVKRVLSSGCLNLTGIHCHIGSQIFDSDSFVLAVRILMEFMAKIKEETGAELSELDIGGGFGIKYTDSGNPPKIPEYVSSISAAVRECATLYGLKMPFVLFEPGRSIVGSAGVTLYTVGFVKEIPGVRTYVGTDGGMFESPRYALYKAKFEAVCANRANEPWDQTVTLAGKCCESGDLIQEHTRLQKVEPGDIVAVLSTGAYNYSMASNYNRNPRPAIVMVKEGETKVVVRGESYDDLIKNDL